MEDGNAWETLLLLGGYGKAPWPCRWEEGGSHHRLPGSSRRTHVSQVYAWELSLGLCWGSLQGHPQGVFKAPTAGGWGRDILG